MKCNSNAEEPIRQDHGIELQVEGSQNGAVED
jgi:hypothetical protein